MSIDDPDFPSFPTNYQDITGLGFFSDCQKASRALLSVTHISV